MTIVDGVENWLMSVCVKRGVEGAIAALCAYMATHGIQKVLTNYGVAINWQSFQAESILTICGLLHMLHDYLKVKKGIAWL